MNNTSVINMPELVVIIPAAGVGKRMQANCPKQYLTLLNKTILEHTVTRLLAHPDITQVIIALGEHDEYFSQLPLAQQSNITTVVGGKERVDSVLAGLKAVKNTKNTWALVHDAARPCVTLHDIDKLIKQCIKQQCGGILATPVRDTMKRGQKEHPQLVQHTENRDNLWHALTPQMYPVAQLISAIELALANQHLITDESSAIEFAGFDSLLVEASNENIKITRQDDLALAEFILLKQNANSSL